MSVNQARSGSPTNIDDEIAALAFQLEELESYSSLQKGKHRADEPPDGVLALSNFRTELEISLMFLTDRKLAQSISQATHSDALAIAEAAREERQSDRDRRMALQLSGNPIQGATPPSAEKDGSHAQTRLAEQTTGSLNRISLLSMDQVSRVSVRPARIH